MVFRGGGGGTGGGGDELTLRRAVGEVEEEFVDDAELVVAALILGFEIGEVAGHALEAAGEDFGDEESEVRVAGEKFPGIVGDVTAGLSGGGDGGGVRAAGEGGDVADERAGLGEDGDRGFAFDDFEGAGDEDVEATGGFAFGKDDVAGCEGDFLQLAALIEDFLHRGQDGEIRRGSKVLKIQRNAEARRSRRFFKICLYAGWGC